MGKRKRKEKKIKRKLWVMAEEHQPLVTEESLEREARSDG
jgi:hypothetical protein